MRWLVLALALAACQTTQERFEWGETTAGPIGWYQMCERDPEAFSCPD